MTVLNQQFLKSPAALVAIAYAAHRTGDSTLEVMATEELRDRFGIELRYRDSVNLDREESEATAC